MNFVEKAVAGKISDPDKEIDDAIGAWHVCESAQELHEYLGMTEDEYSLFVEQPDTLSKIIAAHAKKA